MTKEQAAEQWLLTKLGNKPCIHAYEWVVDYYTEQDKWDAQIASFIAGMESERAQFTQLIAAAREAVRVMEQDGRLGLFPAYMNLSSALKPFEQ